MNDPICQVLVDSLIPKAAKFITLRADIPQTLEIRHVRFFRLPRCVGYFPTVLLRAPSSKTSLLLQRDDTDEPGHSRRQSYPSRSSWDCLMSKRDARAPREGRSLRHLLCAPSA